MQYSAKIIDLDANQASDPTTNLQGKEGIQCVLKWRCDNAN